MSATWRLLPAGCRVAVEPLVERALQVLERREVRPQLGLLKSTMLQLDSSFSERAYGAGSFTDFIEKLRKADLIFVTGNDAWIERLDFIRKKGTHVFAPSAKSAFSRTRRFM